MIEHDVLSELAHDLRNEFDGAEQEACTTRSTVLRAVRADRRRRGALVTIALPIAALLAVSASMAAVGQRLPWLRRDAEQGVESTVPGDPPRDNARTGAPASSSSAPPPAVAPSATASNTQPVAIEDLPVLSGHQPLTERVPSGGRSAAAAASSTAASLAAASARGAGGDALPAWPDRELYLRAHAAHFSGHDFSTAVRLWSEYLAAYPQGLFSVEAHYNRGVALARVGRLAEARAELLPFAQGRYDAYHRQDACLILETIGSQGASSGAHEPSCAAR